MNSTGPQAHPPRVELAPGVAIGGSWEDSVTSELPVIAGPCALESEALALEVAERVGEMASTLGLALIFKSSFDKANRSSFDSYRGPGLDEGLRILAKVKEQTGLPVLTDVHEPDQCAVVAEVCDVLQIPAFLCRQTDLVVAAAETGRGLNIKKGQFVAPEDFHRVIDKARRAGTENQAVTATERGYSFGYNNLVVDMRAFPMLRSAGIPTLFDVTHSLQLPGGGEQTGGARQFAEPLARAAIVAGADGVFLEVHPDPENALSDSTTQLSPDRAEALLRQLLYLRDALVIAAEDGTS